MASEQTGHMTGFLGPLEGFHELVDKRIDGNVVERSDKEAEP